MATPLAVNHLTGKPMRASEAPYGTDAPCWYCQKALVRRRTSRKGLDYYITRAGQAHLHDHLICASLNVRGKQLLFENIYESFHEAMALETASPHPCENPGERGHIPPNDSNEEIYAEKLTSLTGLARWGLYDCPEFKVDDQHWLSSIVLNNKMAPQYFSAGPDTQFGSRAIVVRPEMVDDERMFFRYCLDYDNVEHEATSIYFYHIVESRSIFETIKKKLFVLDVSGTGYVAKSHLSVIIYGNWQIHGCQWCNLRDPQHRCTGAHCGGFVYESVCTRSGYVCTRSLKQANKKKK